MPYTQALSEAKGLFFLHIDTILTEKQVQLFQRNRRNLS